MRDFAPDSQAVLIISGRKGGEGTKHRSNAELEPSEQVLLEIAAVEMAQIAGSSLEPGVSAYSANAKNVTEAGKAGR